MDFYVSKVAGPVPIIDCDGPSTDVMNPPGVSYGCMPRDYSKYPEAMFAQPDPAQMIDPSEWDARYDEQEALQDSLEHLYLAGPGGNPVFEFLDQNGFPDCWAHSTAHAMMCDRMKRQMPVLRLNAVAVATMLNETNGGWAGLSAKFARSDGYPEIGTASYQWPYQSRRGKVTPELKSAMALNRITEDWVDLTKQVYDQNLTTKQLATYAFSNIACPSDFNWWGHSVCQIRWVRIEAGSWGPLILNSWKGWGRHGLGVLRGSKGIANGAVAIRLTGGVE